MNLRNIAMIRNKNAALVCLAASAVIGASVIGITAAADKTPAVPQEIKDAAVPEEAVEAEDIFEEVDSFITFKKAGIEEYDMLFVEPGQKTVTLKKSEAKEETVNEFTVKIPADRSAVLHPERSTPVNVGTRSIAGEYYTVYDERSGRHVTLSGHEMICQIVNNEVGGSWNSEAIKAQAVAAYTFLRYNDAHGYIPSVGLNPGYSSKINNCVSAVEGVCVYYNGAIIDAVYSASSAGASAPSEKIWGGSLPYLRAVISEYDYKDPNFGVEKRFTKEELKKIIEGNTGLKLSDNPKNWFEIESVFSGRYVDLMKLDGKQYISVNGSSTRVTGALMRSKILGASNLKSTAFEISYKDGVFVFKTFGWGHGVGMSQWGACYYADAGYTYDQILRHYYTGTTLAVSDVNSKAVERAAMTEEQLKKEAEQAGKAPETEPASESAAQSEQPAAEPVDAQPEQSDEPVTTEPVEEEPAPEQTTTQQAEPDGEPAEEQVTTTTIPESEPLPQESDAADEVSDNAQPADGSIQE